MVTIVGVRFKKAGKIYYFSPGELQIAAGDGCIVETARGVEFGHVVIPPRQVPESEVVQPLKQVLRSANAEDYARMEANRRRAEEAFGIAVEKVKEHQLPMRMLEAEYTLDDSKLIFSFSAEGRVDFRELVKDLAAIFRTRIELRQVGVRDEAKILGGLGSCGRSLCCATFLGEFEPVSIRIRSRTCPSIPQDFRSVQQAHVLLEVQSRSVKTAGRCSAPAAKYPPRGCRRVLS